LPAIRATICDPLPVRRRPAGVSRAVEQDYVALTRTSLHAFDHCVLDLVKREVRSSDGDLIDLTETEFRLLALLVENPARVLSRDEIARHIQGHDWSPLDRTVDGHVARLRRKLEGAADEPRMIKSVRGVGYVFAADVSLR